MKVDELVRNLRHVEQGYAEKHYSVGEVRVCDMAKDCADALESLFASNRQITEWLSRNGFKDFEEFVASNQQTKAALAPFQAAAAEYGIDAQTMLTLARSQIATAKENVRLREEVGAAHTREDAAYAELAELREAQRWIAVELDSDELPHDDGSQEDVLCYFSDGEMETFNLYGIRDWNKSDNGKTRSDKATHYMRLPDPPQKG